MAGRHGLAAHLVGLFKHSLHQLDAARHCLARAAGVLDVEGVQQAAFAHALVFHQPADLVGFATQPHHHQPAEIGMARIAA
ncbi:hypothetical protein G6F46_015647 [Rhizopus delemar]|nr:hypothetical protein G6F46_015647 [Rhizopus delemar]